MRFVRAVARIARWFAYTSAVSAVLIAYALRDDGWLLAVAAAAAIPAVVLWLFSTALLELAELPTRLRGAPAQAGELRRAVDQLGQARGLRLARALWRAGRTASETRGLVTPWAPLLPLLSGPFLAATAASVLATPFELVIALVLLVVA
jgi:hypothetical protein